jgi:hypothetical protein
MLGKTELDLILSPHDISRETKRHTVIFPSDNERSALQNGNHHLRAEFPNLTTASAAPRRRSQLYNSRKLVELAKPTCCVNKK